MIEHYLLDTHAWIFFFEDSPRLSDLAADIIESPNSICHISIASIWETAIKVGLGKLHVGYDIHSELPHIFEKNGFSITPIEFTDATRVVDLPCIHGDPFDRIQAVQATLRNWKILSRDSIFDQYPVKRIW